MSDDIWRRRERERDDTGEFGGPLFPDDPADDADESSIPGPDDDAERRLSFGPNDTGPLPHWTDPPTGEVPRLDPNPGRGDEDDDIDVWSSFTTETPIWRDDDPLDAPVAGRDPSGSLPADPSSSLGRDPSGEVPRDPSGGFGRDATGEIRSDPISQEPRPSFHSAATRAASSSGETPSRRATDSSIHGRKSSGARSGKLRSRLVISPLGSMIRAGIPESSASSRRSMARPVLPDPVIPTITPWVVRSDAS